MIRTLLASAAILAGCAPVPARARIADGRLSITPWGFNYDHDETGRLIEDYWHDEWPKIDQGLGVPSPPAAASGPLRPSVRPASWTARPVAGTPSR